MYINELNNNHVLKNYLIVRRDDAILAVNQSKKPSALKVSEPFQMEPN